MSLLKSLFGGSYEDLWKAVIRPNPQSPIPNPQSPIPNPQSPCYPFFI